MKAGFIGAQYQKIMSVRWTTKRQREVIQECGEAGRGYEVVVVSIDSGKSGTNLQGMSRMISLGWIAAHASEEQATGTIIDEQ